MMTSLLMAALLATAATDNTKDVADALSFFDEAEPKAEPQVETQVEPKVEQKVEPQAEPKPTAPQEKVKSVLDSGTARIVAKSTYYDRNEGIVVFKGNVFVDDEEYQLHADRAYLFLSPTNTLSRIAALGSVAMTNGTKRAYGDKVTYRHESGLVVLQGQDGKPAVVVEDAATGERKVQGRKIRFWVNDDQIEVLEADITAPKNGAESALPSFGK